MEKLFIEGSDDTPEVLLNPENDKFEIKGMSMPEDVAGFYDPVIDWVEEYAENAKDKTVFNFKFSYFNTASSKAIMDIMMGLKDIEDNGKEILINWYYPEDDDDMEEAGEEYEDITEAPFKHISYKPE